MEKKFQTNLIITNEVFTDDAGNEMPFVAYTVTLSNEPFKLVPLKKDKKLLSYLLTRNKLMVEGKCEVPLTLSQEQFRDTKKRKTIDYVAYTISLCNREFRLFVRDDDKLLIKYILEEDYGFCLSDEVKESEEEEDDE